MPDEPKPAPTPAPEPKKPDQDPVIALGNAVNDLRKAVEDGGKKYDAALAALEAKIPVPKTPPVLNHEHTPDCPFCATMDYIVGTFKR